MLQRLYRPSVRVFTAVRLQGERMEERDQRVNAGLATFMVLASVSLVAYLLSSEALVAAADVAAALGERLLELMV